MCFDERVERTAARTVDMKAVQMVDKLAAWSVWTRADLKADISVETWAGQKAVMKVAMKVGVLAASTAGWLVETKASLKVLRSAVMKAAPMVDM